jgi:hypothetical protein
MSEALGLIPSTAKREDKENGFLLNFNVRRKAVTSEK